MPLTLFLTLAIKILQAIHTRARSLLPACSGLSAAQRFLANNPRELWCETFTHVIAGGDEWLVRPQPTSSSGSHAVGRRCPILFRKWSDKFGASRPINTKLCV